MENKINKKRETLINVLAIIIAPFYYTIWPFIKELYLTMFTKKIWWLNNGYGGKIRLIIGALLFCGLTLVLDNSTHKTTLSETIFGFAYIILTFKYIIFGFMLIAGFRFSPYESDYDEQMAKVEQKNKETRDFCKKRNGLV